MVGFHEAQLDLAPTGIVYFLREGNSGHTKIGWTVCDPVARLNACQTGNPHRLYLCVAELHGPPSLERDMHNHFADARGIGEWFITRPDLLALSSGKPLPGTPQWIVDALVVARERRVPSTVRAQLVDSAGSLQRLRAIALNG